MGKAKNKVEDSAAKKDETAASNLKKRGRAAAKTELPAKVAEEEKPAIAEEAKGADAEGDKVSAKDEPQVEEQKQPPKKKAKLSKAGTMAVTAKEGAELLKDKALGDTRSASKQKTNTSGLKRDKSIHKAIEEAEAAYGTIDTSAGRTLRKRPPPASPAKPSLKKAGTMQKTAKEGKEFLKRGSAKKGC